MFEKEIRRHAARPVLDVSVNLENFELIVTFVDQYVVQRRIDTPLRTFFTTLSGIRRIDDAVPSVSCPLGFFDLLGFRPGDRAVVADGNFFIEFSS